MPRGRKKKDNYSLGPRCGIKRSGKKGHYYSGLRKAPVRERARQIECKRDRKTARRSLLSGSAATISRLERNIDFRRRRKK